MQNLKEEVKGIIDEIPSVVGISTKHITKPLIKFDGFCVWVKILTLTRL